MRKTLMGLAAVVVLAVPGTAVAATCSDSNPTFNGKQSLWPPNHKYSNYSVTATNDEPGTDIRLTLTGRSSQWITDDNGDPVDEYNGSGNTPFLTDISPNPAQGVGTDSVTVNQSVRAERSGRDLGGRTYTITALVENGESTTNPITAQVPATVAAPVHAMRRARPYCLAPQLVPTIALIAVPKPRPSGMRMYSSRAPMA